MSIARPAIGRRAATPILAAGAVTLAAALGGCSVSTSDHLDGHRAEHRVSALLRHQTGAQVKSVDCPSEPSGAVGARFTCTAVAADGTSAKVVAHVVDHKDGDDALVRYDATVLKTGELQSILHDRLALRVGGDPAALSVSCPEMIPVTAPKTSVACIARSGGVMRPIAVSIDRSGVSYRIADQK